MKSTTRTPSSAGRCDDRNVAASVRSRSVGQGPLSLQNRLPGVPVNGASTYTIAGIFVSIGTLVRVALKYAQEH